MTCYESSSLMSDWNKCSRWPWKCPLSS